MITLQPLARLAGAAPAIASRDSLPASSAAEGRRGSIEPGCELCGSRLGATHRHVIEVGVRGVSCVCHACGLLFARGGTGGRFATIPDRVLVDRAFALGADAWAALGIPVAIAFAYRDSQRDTGVVCYPGPAGITEAELAPEAWQTICDATALAAELTDDVEALLVRGGRGPGHNTTQLACYLVPISAAYELAGRLRVTWHGFSGGAAADAELAAFFDRLEQRGRVT